MLLAEITSSGMDMSVILKAMLTTGVICTVGWVAYVFRQFLYNVVAGFCVLVALLIGGPVVALLAAVLFCPDVERNDRRPAAPRPPPQPRDATPPRVASRPVERRRRLQVDRYGEIIEEE